MQLNFSDNFCADLSLTTDSYGYEYASFETLTEFTNALSSYETVFNLDQHCQFFGVYYFCNYVLIPCDLFTGAPRPICSDSCYYLTTECGSIYNTVLFFASQVYPAFVDDCENTLSHLQTSYGFPCSSNSLEHNCIDLLGRLSVLLLYCLNVH